MKRVWLLGIGVCLTGCLGQESDPTATGPQSAAEIALPAVAQRGDFGSFAASMPVAAATPQVEEDLNVVANIRPTFDARAYEARAEFRVLMGARR
jgi:hypothetical protein